MKIAIMQPYFFPYIGYYQLINAADKFIIYDNIKYTKKGWINRNRILQNSNDVLFSLPLRKDSDSLDICQREIADVFNRSEFLNKFRSLYKKAPFFEETFQLLERIICYNEKNLFVFLHNSIKLTLEYIGIETPILVSSEININHNLKREDKVLAFCDALKANTYLNPIGGVDLYSKENFRNRNIELRFVESTYFEYYQFDSKFVPWLSIIDVMMFNSPEVIRREYLYNYNEI